MIPFHVELKPGAPIYEQVVYAATKSIISRQLRAGDEFPSVRVLSKELKINPNTAPGAVPSESHKKLWPVLISGRLHSRRRGRHRLVRQQNSFRLHGNSTSDRRRFSDHPALGIVPGYPRLA